MCVFIPLVRELNVSYKTQPPQNVHLFPSQKIKAVYLKDPEKYVTLQDIVVSEREAHAAEWPKVGATLALMWLKRWPSCCVMLYGEL